MSIRICTFLVLFGLVPAGSLLAQSQTDAIELTRTVIQAERQALVTVNMGLTDEQSQVFWPIYRKYREEGTLLGDRWLAMIKNYAEHHENLSNEVATDIMSEYLAVEAGRLDLKQKYIKEFGKVLEPKLVMRFFQIENKMDAIIEMDIVGQVPLAR